MAQALFDMHCHLDFASNAEQAACALQRLGAGAFSATVSPAGFEDALTRLAAWPRVRVGVGLHPWWVEQCQHQLDRACTLLREHPFVGEVGLDFSAGHARTREAQLQVFERIMQSCAREGGKLVSIHAVRSVDCVLDVLQQSGALDTCTCIIHWFSDSSAALTRAIRAGCWFSLGQASLATKRGRAYVRAIPADRLLVETDYPAQGSLYDVGALQRQMGQAIADIESLRGASIADEVCRSSARLLQL